MHTSSEEKKSHTLAKEKEKKKKILLEVQDDEEKFKRPLITPFLLETADQIEKIEGKKFSLKSEWKMCRTKRMEKRNGKLGEDVRRVNPLEDNNKKYEFEGGGRVHKIFR